MSAINISIFKLKSDLSSIEPQPKKKKKKKIWTVSMEKVTFNYLNLPYLK